MLHCDPPFATDEKPFNPDLGLDLRPVPGLICARV